MNTKVKTKILAWFLIFAMGITLLAETEIIHASTGWTPVKREVEINPLYEDVYTEEQKQAIRDQLSSIADAYEMDPSVTTSVVFGDMDSATDYVREQMVNRIQTINITVEYDKNVSTPRDIAIGIRDLAMAYSEDCTGQEGDAIAGVYTGISTTYSYTSTQVTVEYVVNYRTTLEQENELTTAVNAALTSLNLNGKTEYQKVRAIYDYICDNVNYDYAHLEEQENNGIDYPLMYTAYAALCDGEAVCQGYALLFYRMCKDAGLSVRYISGWGNGGAHAWNIVRIGDVYYNVDSTWDGQDEESYHRYFLKNQDDFLGHIRSSDYETTEFHSQFLMAEDSWEDFSNLAGGLNISNLAEMNYTTISDGTISNQASGRPKVLVFGRVNCYNTRNTIANISDADFSDVDIVYVDAATNTKEDVIAFRDTYGSATDDITYTYNPNGTNMWNYVWATIGQVNSITFPFIVYIDSNNMIQAYQSAGVFSANSVRTKINAYLFDSEMMTISDSSLSLKVDENKKIVATILGLKRNGQFLTWTSSNSNVAAVDENGNVTAIGEGTATITCKANDALYKTCQVNVNGTVVVSMELDATAAGMVVGDSMKLNATVSPISAASKGITWSSSNTSVATVDQNGNVKALSVGSTVITATLNDGSGVNASCTITVNPLLVRNIEITYDGRVQEELSTIYIGTTYDLDAVVKPADATNTTIKWVSSNAKVATVDQNGVVTTTGIGETIITASATDGSGVVSNAVKVVVTQVFASSIHLNYKENTLKIGENFTLEAEVWPDITTYKEVTWTSDNTAVATVDQNGNVTAVSAGTAIVTATTTDGTKLSDSCTITVEEIKNGLYQDEDGTWYYYIDDFVATEYTGLVAHNGAWYYVENGVLNWGYTGLTLYNGAWYYVEGGVLNWGYTGLTLYNGTWYYVEGGILNWNYTGLTCYYDTWYYIEGGILNWNYTGLTCYFDTWYYVEGGILNWNYTGLTCYYGTWYYVAGGVLNWGYTGLTLYYDAWYYVEGGVLNWGYTGLCEYYGTWYYIGNGVLDWSFTGNVLYNGIWWYVENGVMVREV